jgi:hypothetical protein
MLDVIRRHAPIVLFVLLCSAGSLVSIYQVSDWGNKLSEVDPGSEANLLREVRNFLEGGLTKYYGLGKLTYPGMYPNDGMTPLSMAQVEDRVELGYVREHVLTADGVYTHYPPGPEYLAYAAATLLGPEPVSHLRLLPIAIGCAATIFLGISVRRRFGPTVGWLVMVACALTPTVYNGFVGLHSQGYAFAMLLVEISLAIGLGVASIPFAILGFIQGWLSFDYVFLVCLAPLAIEAAMPRIETEYRSRWPLAWRRAMLAGVGFTFAHIVHFTQVWAYWGDFHVALNDFVASARYRAGGTMSDGIFSHIKIADQLLNNYYLGVHPFSPYVFHLSDDWSFQWLTFRFLGLSLGPWWLMITTALALRQFLSRTKSVASLADNWLRVSLLGILTSSSWFIVMVNHGAAHQFFLYRHLFFAFFIALLFGAVTFCRCQTEPAVYDERVKAGA